MQRISSYFIVILFGCVLWGCKHTPIGINSPTAKKADTAKVFTLISPSYSGIEFENDVKESDTQNAFYYPYMYNGGGVATGDINNDGLVDVFFTSNQASCKLYLNLGNFKFKDITESAGLKTTGWCTGVTMADVNGDGWLDIYVCRSGAFCKPEDRRNLLFINNKNNTFTEMGKQYGLDNDGYSTQAAFFDYDRDGDLDMYLANNGTTSFFKINDFLTDNHSIDPYVTHRLFRNNGNGTFTDVSKQAGILCNAYGLNAVVSDINNDGWPDIYVSNDYEMHDFYYINNKKGKFIESWDKCFRHGSYYSMGSDAADFNNDGNIDIMTLDMRPEDNRRQKLLYPFQNYDKYLMMLKGGYGSQFIQNCLQLNNGDGSFSEIGEMAGVSSTDWSWGTVFCDLDNDGAKDIFITNGVKRDLPDLDFNTYRYEESRKTGGVEKLSLNLLNKMPVVPLSNYLYHNTGNLGFTNVTNDWGFTEKTFSNGLAYADLNNDGAMDLVINNLGHKASIYKNNTTQKQHNNYIKIKLKYKGANSFAIGARINIDTKGTTQMQELEPVRGFQSSVDYGINFGTGKYKTIDSIQVTWPDQNRQILRNVSTDQTITIKYTKGLLLKPQKKPVLKPLLVETSKDHNIKFNHQENEYIDFKNEPLLPHMLSRLGPGIGVGDVNNDGLEDLFIGGAAGQSGELYLQQTTGKFKRADNSAWKADAAQEDMACLFFDFDGDGDLDLYVVSGDNTHPGLSPYYQDRLYENDGKGHFKKNTTALPVINGSGSCIIAADFDGDGDLDLFRGGRTMPGSYPESGKSYLLINDHGKFHYSPQMLSGDLQFDGMVTSAIWTDFDGDGDQDLIVVGEWMPITFYRNDKGKLVRIPNPVTPLNKTWGWWNSITAADMDHDGDIDYILGNEGTNYRIKASPSKPASITYKDFDGNGTVDAIISQFAIDGKSYPLPSRDDLTDQIRMLRKRLLRYYMYADKTVNELFTPDEFKNAKTRYAQNFESSYLENLGNGKFKLHALSVKAQLGPVFGVQIDDFNNDGNNDILLEGNSYSNSYQTGRSDALNGLLLLGNGHGGFFSEETNKSGFYVPYDAKAMAKLYTKTNQDLFVVANNNGPLQVFEKKIQNKPERFFKPGILDSKVEITLSTGKKIVAEICYGSGYLSSSTRTIAIPKNATSIKVYDTMGKTRTLSLK